MQTSLVPDPSHRASFTTNRKGPKLAPYSLTFHYACILYIGKVHDIVYNCRSVSDFRIIIIIEAVHYHSVWLLIIAGIEWLIQGLGNGRQFRWWLQLCAHARRDSCKIVIAHTSVVYSWKQITEIQSHLGVLAALPKLSWPKTKKI